VQEIELYISHSRMLNFSFMWLISSFLILIKWITARLCSHCSHALSL